MIERLTLSELLALCDAQEGATAQHRWSRGAGNYAVEYKKDEPGSAELAANRRNANVKISYDNN